MSLRICPKLTLFDDDVVDHHLSRGRLPDVSFCISTVRRHVVLEYKAYPSLSFQHGGTGRACGLVIGDLVQRIECLRYAGGAIEPVDWIGLGRCCPTSRQAEPRAILGGQQIDLVEFVPGDNLARLKDYALVCPESDGAAINESAATLG